MRALIHYTAYYQDQIELGEAGEATDVDLDTAERMNDLLLPIVKGVGSERSYEQLAQSLQTYGGSGFLQDYPIEQYLRDSKIDTLYEGTTAIQGLDLFFRKMVKDQFHALTHLGREVADFAKGDAGNGTLAAEREMLGKALEDVQGIVGALGGYAMKSQTDPTELYKVGQNTTRLLLCVGDLVIGWLLLRQAAIAIDALAGSTSDSAVAAPPSDKDRAGSRSDTEHAGSLSGKDRAFYEGKVAAARFFAHQRFPLLTAERAIAEAADNTLMTLDESAF
jgi:hypothetical protein